MRPRSLVFSLAAWAAMATASEAVWAQYGGPVSQDPLLMRVEQQDARIRELEQQLYQQRIQQSYPTSHVDAHTNEHLLRRLEALEAAASKQQEVSEPEWEDTSNEGWTVEWEGRIMGDYVLFANQDAGNLARFGDQDNFFEFRRLRIGVAGEGYGVYDYALQIDFASEEGYEIKDVFLGIDELPVFNYVRFGHYFAPFSLEQLTSSNVMTFMERALPVEVFSPGRRVGVTSYNGTADSGIIWQYGAFFDDISDQDMELISDSQGIQLVSRVAASPIYYEDGRYVLHLGSSFAWVDDQDDRVRFDTRPEVHEGARFVDTGDLVTDDFYKGNLESAVVYGPLSLQSELFFARLDETANNADYYGAYAFASWFITGESRTYDRTAGAFDEVEPFTNFWIVDAVNGRCAGWGAWELAARWSYVDFRPAPDVDAGQLNDITLGLNWYWNTRTRLMFNWIHSWGQYDTAVGGFNDGEADILATRLHTFW